MPPHTSILLQPFLSTEQPSPVRSSCSYFSCSHTRQPSYPVQYVDALIEDLLSFQPSAQQLLAQLQEKVLLSQQAAAAEAQKFSGSGKQGEAFVLHKSFAVTLLAKHGQQWLSGAGAGSIAACMLDVPQMCTSRLSLLLDLEDKMGGQRLSLAMHALCHNQRETSVTCD